MTKIDNARPYHHGNLAAVLRQAAWDIVGEAGVRGLSLRECARRANVSHSAPAHHFGSMENLLSEIAADGYERMATIISAVQSELDDAVLGCGIGYVKFATTYPHHFRLMFGRDGAPRTLPRLLESSEATLQLLRETLRKAWVELNGAEPGAVLLDQRTFLAWSAAHGYASLAIDRKPNEMINISPEAVFKPLADKLLIP
jgi:AcrR family transcriptional regulator